MRGANYLDILPDCNFKTFHHFVFLEHFIFRCMSNVSCFHAQFVKEFGTF